MAEKRSTEAQEERVRLMEVPLTADDAYAQATHACGGCGRPLRLAADRNWPLHGCGKGGTPISHGFRTVYPSEEEMRFGPTYLDSALWEFMQTVLIPNRKPLPDTPLEITDPAPSIEETS